MGGKHGIQAALRVGRFREEITEQQKKHMGEKGKIMAKKGPGRM